MYDRRMLIPVEGLISLEEQNRWFEACVLLQNAWLQDRHNVDKLVRLALELWYVVLEGPVIEFNDETKQLELEKMLAECTDHGFAYFQDQIAFLWAFSYMLSVSNIPFQSATSPTANDPEWELTCKMLAEKGMQLFPVHPLSTLTFHSFADLTAYGVARREIQDQLLSLFPGDSELEKYFREIYSVHIE